jgi:hypothetical protein
LILGLSFPLYLTGSDQTPLTNLSVIQPSLVWPRLAAQARGSKIHQLGTGRLGTDPNTPSSLRPFFLLWVGCLRFKMFFEDGSVFQRESQCLSGKSLDRTWLPCTFHCPPSPPLSYSFVKFSCTQKDTRNDINQTLFPNHWEFTSNCRGADMHTCAQVCTLPNFSNPN